MSFHNPINERGAHRNHLNRIQNLAPRAPAATSDVETGMGVTPSASTAITTSKAFPVPKGSTPFGSAAPSTASPSTSVDSSSTQARATAATPVVGTSANDSASPTTTIFISASTPGPDSVSKTKGISSGGVGAIIAVVILIAIGVGVFVKRRSIMRRREMKRTTWGAGLVPALENKRGTLYNNPQDPNYGNEPKPPMASANIPPSPAPIQVPVASYNSTPFVSPTIQVPNNEVSPVAPRVSAEVAMVVRTFVPNLPDELHISTGEHIRVLSAFDDGWALCANIRNEQGVVPLECLQREGKSSQTEMQLQPESAFGYDNRASKRLSSLAPSVAGTY